MVSKIELTMHEEYRQEAAAWLAKNAAQYREPREYTDAQIVLESKRWIQVKYAAGYSGIDAPAEIGGAGKTKVEASIFAREESQYHTPIYPSIATGFHTVMGMLTAHASAEQCQNWGLATYSGQVVWCQLFSEPAAGSDLAAVRTTAVRERDQWRVNGQKVWSTFAEHADWGILIARTDSSVAKHKGMTMFVVDMKSAGIETRPIRQITGDADFTETFLDNVLIPDSNRVGAEGDGWRCCLAALAAERNMTGPIQTQRPRSVESVIRQAFREEAGGERAYENSALCEKLARMYVQEQGARHFRRQLAGRPDLMSAAPLGKLVGASLLQELSSLVIDLDGYDGLFTTKEEFASSPVYDYLYSPSRRIAGGGDEIIRNQIAERVLGLPQEPRVDKDVPFDELAR